MPQLSTRGTVRTLGITLYKVHVVMERLAEQALRHKVQMTIAQARMLMALHWFGALSQKRLAESHGLTQAAISRKIEELIKRKLVTRIVNPASRREYILTITAAGNRRARLAERALEEKFHAAFSVLEPKQLADLHKLMSQLLSGIWREEKSALWAAHDHISRAR